MKALVPQRRRNQIGDPLLIVDDEDALPWLAVAQCLDLATVLQKHPNLRVG